MLLLRALFFILSILSAFAIPTPQFGSSVIHEQVDAPKGFVSDGHASGNTSLTLHIALKSSDMQGLEKRLYEVSTPSSPSYGQHLTKEEAESFVAPSSDTKLAVKSWLNSQGIQPNDVSLGVNYLSFNVTVSQANKMLDAEFTVWRQENSSETFIRALKYSLPSKLKEQVNVVIPTVSFPITERNAVTFARILDTSAPTISAPSSSPPSTSAPVPTPTPPSNLSVCNGVDGSKGTSPACVQALYGLPNTVGPQNKSRIAVAGLLQQFPQQADLFNFLRKFRPDLDSHTSFSVQSVEGGQDPQNSSQAGVEANLDIEYTIGVAAGVPVTFVSVGSVNGRDGFLDLANFLLGEADSDLPQVVSISYGSDESVGSAPIAQQTCNAFMQLGARGVSILVSSGDGGVSGGSSKKTCTKFIPTSPSNCPFVTSVGATQGHSPETAAALSSGGFSNIFAMPAYQKTAVNTYLKQIGTQNAGLFNSSGRAFPDISAQGINYLTVSGGGIFFNSGTSVSAPIVASAIALTNAFRLQDGKSALGFLNPLIYSVEDLFTDITSGNNPGCNTNGFPALVGWDPITGLGTPNFDKLKALP